MTRKNQDQEPELEPTEAMSTEALFAVDPDTMSAPDQAEVQRLWRLRELSDDPAGYDAQLQAISDKYRQ